MTALPPVSGQLVLHVTTVFSVIRFLAHGALNQSWEWFKKIRFWCRADLLVSCGRKVDSYKNKYVVLKCPESFGRGLSVFNVEFLVCHHLTRRPCWRSKQKSFSSKNLHENGVYFPEERNAFAVDHQRGRRDVTYKPAIGMRNRQMHGRGRVQVCVEKTPVQHVSLWKGKICVSVSFHSLLVRPIRASFYRPHSSSCHECFENKVYVKCFEYHYIF